MKQRDAALDEEDKAAQLAMATNADTSGMTPQLREFHNLGQRTSIVNYMQATVSEKRVSGAEAEYNDEVFGGNWQQGDYPTEMLLERSEYGSLTANAIADMQGEEKRTLITGVVAGSENESYVARLLAGGDGAYLGASYPSVGPGRHSFPIVSGSTVAATIARGTAEVPAGGISIVNADPARVQHSYEINSADELQMPGLMPYMQSDLRESLTSGLDVKVLTDLLSGLTEVNDNTTMTLAKLLRQVRRRGRRQGRQECQSGADTGEQRKLYVRLCPEYRQCGNVHVPGAARPILGFLQHARPRHRQPRPRHRLPHRRGRTAAADCSRLAARAVAPGHRAAPARRHHHHHRRHVRRRDRGQQRPASAVGIHQCLGHAATDDRITRAASCYATAACVSTMTRRATRTFRATW